jgi:hypothetical protein
MNYNMTHWHLWSSVNLIECISGFNDANASTLCNNAFPFHITCITFLEAVYINYPCFNVDAQQQTRFTLHTRSLKMLAIKRWKSFLTLKVESKISLVFWSTRFFRVDMNDLRLFNKIIMQNMAILEFAPFEAMMQYRSDMSAMHTLVHDQSPGFGSAFVCAHFTRHCALQ